jgi:hypothetical protein
LSRKKVKREKNSGKAITNILHPKHLNSTVVF